METQVIHVCREGVGIVGSAQLEFARENIATSNKYVWVCNAQSRLVSGLLLDSHYRPLHDKAVSLSDGISFIDCIAVNV